MGRLICSLALVTLLLSVAGGSALLAAAQDSGEILIVKTICDGQGVSSLNLARSPEEAAKRPDDCLEGQGLPKGEFVVFDATSRSLVTTLTTDPATGVASASLPPGTYEVVESSGATIPPLTVTVISGQTTVVRSIDYTERIDATTCGDELEPVVPEDPEPIVSGGPWLSGSFGDICRKANGRRGQRRSSATRMFTWAPRSTVGRRKRLSSSRSTPRLVRTCGHRNWCSLARREA
jgi:hypothetical protein